MNMPISSISAGIRFTPAPDITAGTQLREKQRAAADKVTASLPGNNGDSPHIHRVAADIQQVSQTFNKKLQFVVDQQSNEVIVKVIDKTTDKVIKVLPPEELQRLHRRLKEAIGFLFNEQV
ncbi:MAG: flagellar protein FlaG [Treponema sp.]|jgi:flagellar protein FlaG|nr:flagellar protein FlaG [Treponema sp.]